MPITQSRMLSLIGAALDYQQAMDRFFELAQTLRADVQSGGKTEAEAFNILAINLRPELLLNYPLDSPLVIRLEQEHYRRESRRNARKAQKARENKAAAQAGLPPPARGDGSYQGQYHRTRTKLPGLPAVPTLNSALRTGQGRAVQAHAENAPAVQPSTRAQLADAGLDDQAELEEDFGEAGQGPDSAPAPSPDLILDPTQEDLEATLRILSERLDPEARRSIEQGARAQAEGPSHGSPASLGTPDKPGTGTA